MTTKMTPELKNLVKKHYDIKKYILSSKKAHLSREFQDINEEEISSEFYSKYTSTLTQMKEMAEYIKNHPKLEFGYEFERLFEEIEGEMVIRLMDIFYCNVDYTKEQIKQLKEIDKQIRDLIEQEQVLIIRLSMATDFETIQSILKEYNIEI